MNLSPTRIAALVAGAAIGAALIFVTVNAQPANEAEIRKAFATADVNGDGYIDVNEFVAHTIYIFRQMDTNGDGFVTVQEWTSYNPGNAERFKAADRDGDGKLSLGEAVAVKMIEFFDIDRNRDGVITVEELLVYERSLPPANPGK
jgi:Ca2+-binding EF-hand superfamily protein